MTAKQSASNRGLIIEHPMSEDGLHPFETILRMCAAAAPAPWYPRLFVKQEGVDAKALSFCLEELWISGLIERTDGGSEKGPAITLTREGQRVLLDPEALRRLRADEPLSAYDRAGVIRRLLRVPTRPSITRFLLVLNILIFIAGYYSAGKVGAGREFLRGGPITQQLQEVLNKSGAITADAVVEGQWWRLLTAGFVHIGFLHLLMNMASLHVAGRFIEQLWGHLRYLVIYLVSVLGGCCLGIAHTPKNAVLAGASGAICGLLAAEAIWFLFNRRYLPRMLLRRARMVFLVNLILLIFISSFQNVSGWGHFGGAAAGALAAMLLQLHRFGPPVWRWLAIAGFVPLVWYGDYALKHARATDPQWGEIERQVLEKHFAVPVARTTIEATIVYRKNVLPVLEKHPTRREAATVEAVLSDLAEQQDKLQAFADALARFGPLLNPNAETRRLWYRGKIDSRLELTHSAQEALRNGSKWSSAEHEQHDFETHFLRVTDATVSAAMEVYRQRIRPVFESDPQKRGATASNDALAALADHSPRLRDLAGELKAAGPYEDETVEAARQAAFYYARAAWQLFDFCKDNLDAGSKQTDTIKESLDKREAELEKYRLRWRDKVE